MINLIRQAIRKRWTLGLVESKYITSEGTKTFDNVQWIQLPFHSNVWYADPFILEKTDNLLTLFVEEWEYDKCKGRIAKLIVDISQQRIKWSIPILDLDTHLSFPYIIRHDDIIYVAPENHQSGRFSIYRYDNINEKLVDPVVLINEPLHDAQIVNIGNEYYIWGMIDTPDKTYIYCSESLLGPYRKLQVIQNWKNEERGAGTIFFHNNMCIRPVQSCEGGYGKHLIFYQIIQEGKCFVEKELYRIHPNNKKPHSNSFHTFNQLEEICIVDGEDFVSPRFARLYLPIMREIKGL